MRRHGAGHAARAGGARTGEPEATALHGLMISLLLAAVALADGPPAWKDAPADVVVERHFDVPPAVLAARVSNFESLSPLFPVECAEEWALGPSTSGSDATARVTVRAAGLRRRLTVRYSKVEGDRMVELDYVGQKGFFTQFRFEPVDGGTDVTLITYLEQPPWPLKRYFVFNVHPAWTSCHERTLEALATAVAR